MIHHRRAGGFRRLPLTDWLASHVPDLYNWQMRVLLAFLIFSEAICNAAELTPGCWEGVVHIPDRELTVVVDLDRGAGGAWVGSITVVGLDIKGAPLSDIVMKAPEIVFSTQTAPPPRGLQGTFKGKLDSSGMLSGNFIQAGNIAPFSLKKTGSPNVEAPPRNTPVAKDLEGEWKGEYELNGYKRDVTLQLANQSQSATAEMVVVGKRTTKIPMDTVIQEGDFLSLQSHGMGMSYECQFRKESREIKGIFGQGPIEIPLVFHRGAAPKTQTP